MVASLLGVGLALYALLVGTLYVSQRRLLYFPDPRRPDIAQVGLAALREIEIATPDGLRLLAWYLPPQPGQPVVVYFHGNGGNLENRAQRVMVFANAGLAALFVEYRGYGGNPGAPSERGLLIDARAALDFLLAQGVAPTRIVLYGESLGSGVAVRAASERPVAALVLQSPYSSIADVAQYHYPFVPAKWAIKDRFDALSCIGRVRAPLLVILGALDVVIPPVFSRRLFDAASEPKELWVAPDAGHDRLRHHGALDAAIDFIRRHVPPG